MKNSDLPRELERILPRVQKPVRYIGGEWNAVGRHPQGVKVRMALAFPDLYEIGSSHLGFRILYSLLNSRPGLCAERVFCPWPDMEGELRRSDLALMSLETFTPLNRFDVIGFSLQCELNFTNILTMLDLSRLPLRSRDRREGDPIIIGGGPVALNAEPIAPFFDAFLIGDGEELLPEFLLRYQELRDSGTPRDGMLRALARIEGVYVPGLYDTRSDPRTGFLIPQRPADAPYPVKRRILMDLDRYPFPQNVVVPHGEIVHDRVSVEIMRGCPVGCRFCQAGIIYRPLRQRDPASLVQTVHGSLKRTGFDEISLTSLNSGEYDNVSSLIEHLVDDLADDNVALSLSSLRPSTVNDRIAAQIRRVRKTGFTIAPEAGTQRMRQVINKNVSEREIMAACESAFRQGWEQLKLYFMIGLPTETDEDVLGIAELGNRIAALGRQMVGPKVRIHLSASSFIPKPHTPFQWVAQASTDSLVRKQQMIRDAIDRRHIRFKWHDVEESFVEGILALGDRSLAEVIERAWRKGCRMDAWGEMLRLDLWKEALSDCGVEAARFLYRRLEPADALPWDVVDSGVGKHYLKKEYLLSLESKPLESCTPDPCYGCGKFARDCISGELLKGTRVPDMVASSGGPAAQRPDGKGTITSPRRTATPPPQFRYRARYFKLGRMKYLSHLDLVRSIARGLRRAAVPLAFSGGFRPAPRLDFASALQVGVESHGEILDLTTTRAIDPAAMLAAINGCLPDGLGFDRLVPVRPDQPKIHEVVGAARYRIDPPPAPTGTVDSRRWHRHLLERFLNRDEVRVVREREGRREEVEIRGAVKELRQDVGSDDLLLTILLGRARTPRPSEVVRGIYGAGAISTRIAREELLAVSGRDLVSPLAGCGQILVPRDILIDSLPGEVRIAVLEDDLLTEVFVERSARRSVAGNVYKGRVRNILPGMQSAFVDVGLERDAFLYVEDLAGDLEHVERLEGGEGEIEEPESPDRLRSPLPIDELIKEGQDIIVQVTKDPIAQKGARITSHVTLPGRYLVYLPGVSHVGVSRKIDDAEERDRLKEIGSSLVERARLAGGLIVRTAGEGRRIDEFDADAGYLAGIWSDIQQRGEACAAPALLHAEAGAIGKVLRDVFHEGVEEVVVDSEEVRDEVVRIMARLQPDLTARVRLHDGRSPLFEVRGVVTQLERALRPRIWLKSGGHIVINQTEALVAIDVNTGKYVGKRRLEETILRTNLEAVREIVRQVRLRDLGGIIVIDFIDMQEAASKQEVIEALQLELKKDRSKSRFLQISEFGLVEITRQRTKPSLERLLCRPCLVCGGSGFVKSAETLYFEIVREGRKMRPARDSGVVLLRLHPDLLSPFLERRETLAEDLGVADAGSLSIEANPSLPPGQWRLTPGL